MGFRESKAAVRTEKQQLKEKKRAVRDEVANVVHATVRYKPPRPGLSEIVELPPYICAWCAEREPTLTRTLCNAGQSEKKKGISHVTYRFDWTMPIPYCDECSAKPGLFFNKEAVLYGQHDVDYESTGAGSASVWMKHMTLVFLNAKVAALFIKRYPDMEIVEWKNAGLTRYGNGYIKDV